MFSQISRERLDRSSIRKLRWKGLVEGYNFTPRQIFDTSWNKGATVEKPIRRAAILTLRRCSVQTGGRRDPKLGVQKVLWIPYRSHLLNWPGSFWVPSRLKSPFGAMRKSETSQLTTLPKKIRKETFRRIFLGTNDLNKLVIEYSWIHEYVILFTWWQLQGSKKTYRT